MESNKAKQNKTKPKVIDTEKRLMAARGKGWGVRINGRKGQKIKRKGNFLSDA